MIKYFIYRFPILLLIFTTLSIIISVFSIFWIIYNFTNILLYLFTGLIFLFHIRVIDDYRDFEHDTKYYSDRELQKWKIDIKKLLIISEILIIIVLMLNYYYFWFLSVFILILWWLNSLISISYFWYWKKIEKNNMILFHILNNFTLNNFFIYLYYNAWVLINFSGNYFLIMLHLLFLNLVVFLLELTRKVKSKDEKNTKDKYIDRYWYKKNSLIILWVSLSIFLIITYFNDVYFTFKYIIYVLVFLIFILLLLLHSKYKIKIYKNLILLFSLIFYLFSNFYFIF